MGRLEDALHETDAQKALLKLLEDKALAKVLGGTLAEIAVELADSKVEARHWKSAFQAVRGEIRALVGIILTQRGAGTERIVVTEKELRAIPAHLELYVGTPEEGVRVYELRPGTRRVKTDVRAILTRPN